MKQKDITKVQRREAELDRDTFSVEKQAIEGSIKVLKDRLNAAKRHVENAEAKVAQLMGEPMIPEFTVMDEIHAVRRLVPERQYKDPGQYQQSTEREILIFSQIGGFSRRPTIMHLAKRKSILTRMPRLEKRTKIENKLGKIS